MLNALEMIEVFKTNVTEKEHANMLLVRIHKTFRDHRANFDLEDCDKILRVTCRNGPVQSYPLIQLLQDFGFQAEILEDEMQEAERSSRKEVSIH